MAFSTAFSNRLSLIVAYSLPCLRLHTDAAHVRLGSTLQQGLATGKPAGVRQNCPRIPKRDTVDPAKARLLATYFTPKYDNCGCCRLYSIFRRLAKILVVDDEELVVTVICAALKSGEHEITVARSGKEALAAAQNAVSIDLLIIDHILPNDRGSDIAKHILLQHPAMRVLHVSGYFREQLEAEESLRSVGFIQKPFTVQQIKAAVTAMMDQ